MDTNKLDDELLSEFIDSFYGYGNYGGRYWFIGMEEGGGKDLKEIQKRLSLWEDRGKRELEDIADYSIKLDAKNRFFTGKYALQTTWNKLIRIVLSAQTAATEVDTVRKYQLEKLGRLDGETCLLELMPLPSYSTKSWIYSEYSALVELKSRETYFSSYAERRADGIKKKIEKHRPSAVVFYSVNPSYMEWWEKIAGTSFRDNNVGDNSYYSADRDGTKFLIVKHPATKGISNNYYHEIGKLLTSLIH